MNNMEEYTHPNKVLEKSVQELFLDPFYIDNGYKIVERASQEVFCEWDVILEKDGRQIKVEEKIIRNLYDFLSIELIEDIPSGKQGWFYQLDVEKVVWVFMERGLVKRVWSIDWPAFKRWYGENCHKFQYYEFWEGQRAGEINLSLQINIEGWGKTLNQLIPIGKIPKEIIKLMWQPSAVGTGKSTSTNPDLNPRGLAK